MNETQQQLPWWLPDPIIVFFIGFLALNVFYDHSTSAKAYEGFARNDGWA